MGYEDDDPCFRPSVARSRRLTDQHYEQMLKFARKKHVDMYNRFDHEARNPGAATPSVSQDADTAK